MKKKKNTDIPISRIYSCISLNTTSYGDSSLAKNISIQTTNYTNRQGMVKPKWVPYSQALLTNF